MVHRAEKKIRRPRIERIVTEAPIFIGGDHDHRHIAAGRQVSQRLLEFGAVEMGHSIIGDDQIRLVVLEPAQGEHGVAKGFDLGLRIQLARLAREDSPVGDPVVDDYNARHSFLPPDSRLHALHFAGRLIPENFSGFADGRAVPTWLKRVKPDSLINRYQRVKPMNLLATAPIHGEVAYACDSEVIHKFNLRVGLWNHAIDFIKKNIFREGGSREAARRKRSYSGFCRETRQAA